MPSLRTIAISSASLIFLISGTALAQQDQDIRFSDRVTDSNNISDSMNQDNDTAKDSFNDTAKDSFNDTAKDSFNDTAKDSFNDTAKDSFNKTETETSNQLIDSQNQDNDTVKESFNKIAEASFNEIAKDSFNEDKSVNDSFNIDKSIFADPVAAAKLDATVTGNRALAKNVAFAEKDNLQTQQSASISGNSLEGFRGINTGANVNSGANSVVQTSASVAAVVIGSF